MTLSNQRMCVVTRERKNKTDLIKITRVKDRWYVDQNQQLFGRSIYLILNENNVERFSKQARRFKIEKENFTEIMKQLEEMI